MKSELNQNLVETLSQSNNEEFLQHINDVVYNVVSLAIEKISQKTLFVRMDKCVLVPANEVYLGSVSQLSTYDYFLGVENPEISFNSRAMKNFWRFAWREFKASWRLGRKKYRKEKHSSNKSASNIEKYQLSDFRHDFVEALSEQLTETSIIYEHMRHVSVVGKNDFGTNVKINIYISVYDSQQNEFKLYNENKNKFSKVYFGERFENLDKKVQECGENFKKVVRIINAQYARRFNRIPNQILVESLVFACPNNLFVKDIYKTFVNVANYIRLVDPKAIASICDSNINVFKERLILDAGNQTQFGRIVNMLDDFKY